MGCKKISIAISEFSDSILPLMPVNRIFSVRKLLDSESIWHFDSDN